MSLWIPLTNRGILGGSVLLYLPMPLLVWMEVMHAKQNQEQKMKKTKHNRCEWKHQNAKSEKNRKLIKRALPSLRSATEQVTNPLTQWSVCVYTCVYIYINDTVDVIGTIAEHECVSLLQLQSFRLSLWICAHAVAKSRHTLLSVQSPFGS